MENDLISRVAVLELIENIKMNPDAPKNYGTLLDIMREIRKIPTAYDVDKVIKRINDIGKIYCDSVKCDKNCDDCEHGCLMYSITNVIKCGGID